MAWSNEVMARNIRRYMEVSGKNQKELAQIVGVSAPTVNDWLKAKKYPRIDKIEIMANYFGCEKSDLIEDNAARTASQDAGIVSPETAETNNLATRLVFKMHDDSTFLSAIEKLIKLDEKQLETFSRLDDKKLTAFLQLLTVDEE